jgi:hypothetical protein
MAKETGKKRYIVAPGVSFVGKKRAYVAGEEIDESAFGKPEYFKKMLSCKPPKIIEAPPEKEEDKKKDSDTTPAPEDEKRKTMEKLAVTNGLLKPEELEQYSNEQLEKLLKDHGVTK